MRASKYPPEFRERAVRIARESDRPIAAVARDGVAVVREIDPGTAFVEGVHDSISLTVPAETRARVTDAWPEPELGEGVPATVVAPEASAAVAPAGELATYAEHAKPIVPPTKANETLQWLGIALFAGSILWLASIFHEAPEIRA